MGVVDEDRWLVHQDGHVFFCSGKLFAVRDEADQVIGFIKICRDQTRQKHAEEEREALLQRD